MKKTVLVTASTSGLGYAIAKAFVNKNYRVIVNGRDEDRVIRACSMLNGSEHLSFTKDMLEMDSVEVLAGFLNKHNVFPDIVVHNLGGRVSNDKQPLDLQTLHKSMRINLEVAIEINNLLIPKMMQKGSGKIVHIGSSSSYNGNAAPAYAVAKGALNTYVKNMARYYARDNILFCAFLPGIMDHEGSEWYRKKKTELEKYTSRKEQMPLGRFAHPDEIADYVQAVVSVENMQATGSIINLEGGF